MRSRSIVSVWLLKLRKLIFGEKTLSRFAPTPNYKLLPVLQASADGDYQRLHQLLNSERHILLDSSAESSRQCLKPKVLCFQDVSRLFYFLKRDACVLQPLHSDDPYKSRSYLVLRKGLKKLRKAANKV